jgi:hypothetical protein
MTRRTGDGLSQRIFSCGQSAIFSAKIAAGKVSARPPIASHPSRRRCPRSIENCIAALTDWLERRARLAPFAHYLRKTFRDAANN